MKQLFLVFFVLVFFPFCSFAEEDSLVDLGWEKDYNDLDGSTIYKKIHEVQTCNDENIVVAGHIYNDGGEGYLLKYSLVVASVYKLRLYRIKSIKWKTLSGDESVDVDCISKITDEMAVESCNSDFINKEKAKSVLNTTYIRLDGNFGGFDMKLGGEDEGCEKNYRNLVDLTSDYLMKVK